MVDVVTASIPSYYPYMNHEIELKLRLNATELLLLKKILNSEQFIRQPTLKLLNRYFDTPQMGLSQSGAALRIRQQDELDTQGMVSHSQIIQTLKTRGTSIAGLHQRMEWDWPLAEVYLDLDFIRTSDAKDYVSPILDLNAIAPLFTTNFQRKVWMYEKNDSLIELVLDQGTVSTDEHAVDLLELELELKRGHPEVLFEVAQQIAQLCPVLMSDISKAERGYGLLALSPHYKHMKKDWVGKVPKFDEKKNVLECFTTFFAFQLSVCQRSLEHTIWDCQSDKYVNTQQQLELLQQLLSLFKYIDSLPEARVMNNKHHDIQQGDFEISLDWGQFSLACGQWLFNLTSYLSEAEGKESLSAMTESEKTAMRLYIEKLSKGMSV
jgi:inorganic triphosphatase YgiF